MADPGGGAPLIFRPNWGPKGQKNFLETRPYLKVCISRWVHYGNFLVLIDVKDNSPRLSPVKPFQATRKAVVQRITKNSLRKSYICLLLKYPLLYQLRSLKVKKNFYFGGIVNDWKPGVVPLIGQFSRDFIGHLSVKPWCHWVWRVYMWLVRFNLQFMFEVSSVWPHSKEQELTEMQISGPVSVEEQLNLIPI